MPARTTRTCLSVFALALLAASVSSNEPGQILAASGELPPIHQYEAIDTLPTNDAASMAISPDGMQLAFVAPDQGRNRLWVQDIKTGAARVFPGTSEVRWPFWSPDGKDIGFFNNDQVWRVDVATGKTQVIVPAATWAAGGTWGPNGVILYGRHGAMSILAVSTDGSGQRSVTDYPANGQLAHFHPFFLPDGKHFLYYVEGSAEVRGIYVGTIGPGPIVSELVRLVDVGFPREQDKRLVDAQAGGVYAMGRLFFVRGGTLLAQPFNTETRSLSGSPQVVARDIAIGGRNGVALSATGDRVIYRTGAAGSTQQLTWFDRSGRKLGTVGEPFAGGAGAMSISPDGTRVVVNRYVDGPGEIFTVDLATGTATQVSDFPANNSYPVWSFDSQAVFFSSNLTVGYQAFRRAAGDAAAAPVFQTQGWRHPMDMSRDGRYLIYRMNQPDLWALDTQTQAEIPVIRPGSATAQWPQISPDGRWFAYQSADFGGAEIYLHGPFDPPNVGLRTKPVSISDGGWARWRADGRELYYVTPDGSLMAVALTFGAGGNDFTAAAPVKLFAVPMHMGSINSSIGQQYMPDKTGERFLVLAAMPAKSPVHVLGSTPRE
jgi:Tol biopolymer transport system component